jgi:UDP-N-acetylmuramoyl-tripeptide--D-alanyl-D-alanine ligase
MQTEQLYALFLQSTGITTDSRKIEPGNIFFALKGENFDGNTYAHKAIEAGALLAVIDDPAFQNEKTFLSEDVLQALQTLARHHRRQFDIPVIGITGSNGKTTTKELVNAVLSKKYNTLATIGNLNNHIGVPLTLLRMNHTTEIAIIEMGANHVGEIGELSLIAEPNYGLITGIGKAHLGEFGGFEGVKQTKAELYSHLVQNHGTVFLNTDLPVLEEMAQRKLVKNAITYGSNSDNKYIFKFIDANPNVCFSYENHTIHSQLVGSYNYHNLITAFALGKYFNVPENDIADALEQYQSTNNRSQIMHWEGNTIIMDAYNANPTSMLAALDNFEKMKAETKVAILGDMLELGEYSAEEHQNIADKVAAIRPTYSCLVGNEFAQIHVNQNIHLATDYNSAAEWLRSLPLKNALLLIKGSRGIKLEKVIQ